MFRLIYVLSPRACRQWQLSPSKTTPSESSPTMSLWEAT